MHIRESLSFSLSPMWMQISDLRLVLRSGVYRSLVLETSFPGAVARIRCFFAILVPVVVSWIPDAAPGVANIGGVGWLRVVSSSQILVVFGVWTANLPTVMGIGQDRTAIVASLDVPKLPTVTGIGLRDSDFTLFLLAPSSW